MAGCSLSSSSLPKNASKLFNPFQKNNTLCGALKICTRLNKISPEKRSYIDMCSAGFEYTDKGDVACCQNCGLEVSGLKSDIKPFDIHKQRSPSCQFVLSMIPPSTIIGSTANNFVRLSSASVSEEPPAKRLKTDTTANTALPNNTFVEVKSLKQVRKRGFSSWLHRSSPSASQMIDAGFFNCNVGDRVICIYCNLICQGWAPNSDDPCEVHKTLSPKCPYVTGILTSPQTVSMLRARINSSSSDSQQAMANLNKTAIHKKYVEPKKRLASFNKCSGANLPPIDDLVKAGFFYDGMKKKITCFYCDGSLQQRNTNDNPLMEHIRQFPHCAYAKQIGGVELHRNIRESKKTQQERVNNSDSNNVLETGDGNSINERLIIPDEDTLSQMVTARLDLPISKNIMNHNFKQSIIKKCWEDQLRFKAKDFESDCDLLMACEILQKQIQYINGNKENIIVPSVIMKKIRDKERTADNRLENQTIKRQLTNPCILCLEEERCLACIPCGHLITCIPCGQVYRSCPTCHAQIDAFVCIYN